MENIKKHATIRIPAKASLWYIGSGAVGRAIGALSTPIFTRLLTPEEYGLYPLYTSWLGILSVLVTLEITGSAIYRGFQKFEDRKDEFTSAALGIISAIFVSFCALYFALYGLISNFIGLDISISIFMLVEIFAASVISLYLAKGRFEYKYRAVSLINILSAVIIPFSAILLIILTNIKAEARIYASSLMTAIIALPLIILTVRKSDKLYSREMWKYLIGHSIPLLPHYFATALIFKVSEISIGRYHGTTALGQYSIAMSVGMMLTIVTGGVLSALSPWIIRKIRENEIERIREFLLLVTRALALVSLVILAAAPEILTFLAAEGFRSALPAIYPLEITVIFTFLSGVIISASAYYERGGLTSLASVGAALVSIVLSLVILPGIDYRFASLFSLISYTVMALLSSLIFKRLSGEYPISIRKSGFILLFTAAYALVLYGFRDYIVSRIFLSLPIISLLLFSAKDIWLKIRE